MLPAMRISLAALVAVAACSRSAPAPSPLRDDLEKVCNVVELAGARDLAANDRTYTIAQWLPENVSPAGREWLIRWARLGEDAAARRKMLETDARAAGIKDCPLVAEWQ